MLVLKGIFDKYRSSGTGMVEKHTMKMTAL